MAGGTQIPISVGRTGNGVVVRADGSCTVAICETVGRFLRGCRKPETTDIFFDLTAAGWLDSTFIGFLLSLVLDKADPNVPTIHLFHPSPAVLDVLEHMHVVHYFDIVAELPPCPCDWRTLDAESLPRDKATNLVIDAHQRLIDVDCRNAPVFQPVVDLFEAHRRMVEERHNQGANPPPRE